VLERDRETAAYEKVAAFAPDQAERHRLGAFRDEHAGGLDHIGVEAAGQPLVAADQNHQRLAVRSELAVGQQRVNRGIDA